MIFDTDESHVPFKVCTDPILYQFFIDRYVFSVTVLNETQTHELQTIKFYSFADYIADQAEIMDSNKHFNINVNYHEILF